MKFHQLLEIRQADLDYSEVRSSPKKGLKLEKVILDLKGNNSGALTRLLKRYERLDKAAQLSKIARDQVNAQIKNIGDMHFDAEDSLVTRIMETNQFTAMLTASQPGSTKPLVKTVHWEAAYNELCTMIPELIAQYEKITEKYTTLTPAKDTPVGLKVNSKLVEGVFSTIRGALASLATSIKEWAVGYDARLKALKKSFKDGMRE